MSEVASEETGAIYITLKEFLAQVEAIEATRPVQQRRAVPSIVELAKAIGIHPITMSEISNNHIVRFNLKTGAAIIDEMRRRGFNMDIKDLLAYRPALGKDKI